MFDSKSMLKTQVQAATYLVLLVVFLMLLYFARTVVVMCLIGIGLGVLVSPILNVLRRRYHIPRAASALLLLVLFTAMLAVVGYGIYSLVADQVQSLTNRAPEIIRSLQDRFSGYFTRYPWIREEINNFNVGETARAVIDHFFRGLQSGFATTSGLVFAGILGLYTAVDAKNYYQGVVRAVRPAKRAKAEAFLLGSADLLRKWFRAQLVDMVIIGALTAIGLWIVGADYWLLFGLLTAIFGIIPYIGILLVVVFAGLVTLASDPGNFFWVVGVFIATQQIEGNVVLPMVMRGQAELPEVPLLIFMLLLGSWLGLLGVFLAPPLFAVLRVAYCELYLPAIEGNSDSNP